MTHNPVSRKNLGFLASKPSVPEGSKGLLYKDGRFIRPLYPGEKVSVSDRGQNTVVYIVDVRNHPLTFSIKLPSATPGTVFPVRIDLEYQVSDERRMVDDGIDDTERLVKRFLVPRLEEQSQRISIEKYQSLQVVLESTVENREFQSYGLTLNRSRVTLDLESAEWEQIKRLTSSQQTSHDISLPSQEPALPFKARVTVAFRITDSTKLSGTAPKDAELLLWPQIAELLRSESRQYTIHQVAQAEQAMQNLVRGQVLHGYGIHVETVQIELDLSEEAAERAKELARIIHEQKVEELKAQSEKLRRDHKGNAIDFYKGIISDDRKDLIAYMLAQAPEDVKQVLQYLDEREKQQFELQMSLLKPIIEQGEMYPDHAEHIIRNIYGNLMQAISSMGLSRSSLPAPSPNAREDHPSGNNRSDDPWNTNALIVIDESEFAQASPVSDSNTTDFRSSTVDESENPQE